MSAPVFVRSMKRFARFALAAVVGAFAVLANPSPAQAQGVFMNPFEERAIGVQGHREALTGMGGSHPDADFAAYVADIGMRVAQTSARHPDQFVFSLTNSGEVNAFTRPGGFIYISAGIIPWINDESEFAALLGHEVGHAINRHSGRSYARENVADRIIDLSERAGRSQQATEDRRVRASLMILAYSREQEFQSDDAAFQVVERLSLDNLGAARMLRQLVLMEGVSRTLNGSNAANYPIALRSHPPGADRVRRSADLAQQTGAGASGPSGRDAFLDRIDGFMVPASDFTGGRATRIRIVTVGAADTAATLSSRMAAPAAIQQQLFLAINGLTDASAVTAGMRVKILGQ